MPVIVNFPEFSKSYFLHKNKQHRKQYTINQDFNLQETFGLYLQFISDIHLL